MREQGTGAAVQGALVLLLDQDDRRLTQALSNDAGRFVLAAPGPGTYRVQAERIGLETLTSAVVHLTRSQTLDLDLILSTRAFALEGIAVEADRRCSLRPEDGRAVALLWDEARKVLENQEVTSAEQLVGFETVRFERELDRSGRQVLGERTYGRAYATGLPIQSQPVEDLLEHGFVRPATDTEGFDFFGPDAEVLLSDAFLDTHCFRLDGPDLEAGRVGLAFEPLDRGGPADITGTLWFGSADGRLRYLDFVYTGLPWPDAEGFARGRVDFDEVRGGLWIVRRWSIRMPRMVRDMSPAHPGASSWRVAGLVEVGGEVTAIDPRLYARAGAGPTEREGRVADTETASLPATAEGYCPGLARHLSALVGMVSRTRGADAGEPAVGARVDVRWTTYRVVAGRELLADVTTASAITDASGRYRVCGVPPELELTIEVSLDGARPLRRTATAAPDQRLIVLDLELGT